MKTVYTKKGFTILEFLGAALISIPLLLIIVLESKKLALNYIKVRNENLKIYNFLRTKVILTQSLEDIDSHPFSIQPIIHHNGQIRLRNGQSNPVNFSSDHLIPSPNSDAFTYFKPDILNMYRITVNNLSADNLLQLYGCSAFKKQLHIEKYQTYLAFSAESYFELILHKTAAADIQNSFCANFIFSPSVSMLFENPEYPANILLIVPIIDLYTIYKDSSGNLRYLSHRGESNIENQPILEESDDLSLSLNFARGLTNLEVVLSDKISQKSFSLINSIARKGHLNIILNNSREL